MAAIDDQPIGLTPQGTFVDPTDRSKPKAADADSLPEKFGRYHILKKLGECGMGAVYLAHDTAMDRRVALKIPKLSGDTGSSERFDREARAAAALTHRHICPVYDVGEIDGKRFLTMAYIEGKPLSDFVKEDVGLNERVAAALIYKIAEALDYAHSNGVIHRDLKPANIMMRKEQGKNVWEPVIIDFGIALRMGKSDSRITQEGAIVGTPAYMAPEQVTRSVGEIGQSCDVYSLGAMLFQLLTGRLPFAGSVTEVITRKAVDDPVPPSTYKKDLDPRLDAICLKAIAKKPEDRHRSMGKLASDLKLFLKTANQKDTPQVLVPNSEEETGPSKSRQTKLPRWAVIGGVCVLLVGGILAWGLSGKPKPNQTVTPQSALVLHWHGFVQAERKGEFMELALKDGMTLFNKDQYRLVLSPSEDCFLYVIGVDRNNPTLLFPNEKIELNNRSLAKRDYQVPDGINWFTLDDQTGTETLYFVASRERLPDLEESVRTKNQDKLDGIIHELEKRSADQLQTRGATIEPDRRLTTAKLKNGREAQQEMTVSLGGDLVVKRIRFEHKAVAP